MFNFKEASVKVYIVQFCKIDTISKAVYSEADRDGNQTRIQFNGPFLIREDEIDKYRNYGGGIESLTLVGTMIDNFDECRYCKCEKECKNTCIKPAHDNTDNTDGFFELKFIPEEGGEDCMEITRHSSLYSLCEKIVELHNKSSEGLNGSKVYNKYKYRYSEDNDGFSPLSYEQALQILDVFEED